MQNNPAMPASIRGHGRTIKESDISNTTCITDGCERKQYFKGQCHGHYVRVGRPKPKPCRMDDCAKTARCQGLCDMHYTRMRRHDDPATILNADRTLNIEERLVRIGWNETDSGCWEFAGNLRHGYGQIAIPGARSEVASRAAYMAWVGPIEDGAFVCHHCDNPACINPQHLFLGTHEENMVDCRSKKRHAHGVRQSHAKLTDERAQEVRDLYATGMYTQTQLGRMFGLSQTGIGNVTRRDSWKHVA